MHVHNCSCNYCNNVVPVCQSNTAITVLTEHIEDGEKNEVEYFSPARRARSKGIQTAVDIGDDEISEMLLSAHYDADWDSGTVRWVYIL